MNPEDAFEGRTWSDVAAMTPAQVRAALGLVDPESEEPLPQRTSAEDRRIEKAAQRLIERGIDQQALNTLTAHIEGAERERDSATEAMNRYYHALRKIADILETQAAEMTSDAHMRPVWAIPEAPIYQVLRENGVVG